MSEADSGTVHEKFRASCARGLLGVPPAGWQPINAQYEARGGRMVADAGIRPNDDWGAPPGRPRGSHRC